MRLNTFFSIVAVAFGLIGSYFTVHGNLFLSPKALLELTTPHSRIDYAPEQINSLTSQQADAVIGILLIFIAFLIQFASFFVSESALFSSHWWNGMIIAMLATCCVFFATYLADSKYKTNLRLEVGKVEIKTSLAEKERAWSNHDLQEFEGKATELLDLPRRPDERGADYIKRVADFCDTPSPKSSALAKLH
jgi:hypothetical protein